MKTCPICHAVAFDDAAVCYGCLHRFTDSDEAADVPVEQAAQDAPERIAELPMKPATELPTFRILFTPKQEPQGALSWTCTVEA